MFSVRIFRLTIPKGLRYFSISSARLQALLVFLRENRYNGSRIFAGNGFHSPRRRAQSAPNDGPPYLIQKFVLDAFGLEYLQTIAFILVIAALVQMVEIILKKVSPALYQALGVFLPLITTNCCILGVAILVIQKDFDLLTGVVYAFSTALGFALAMVLFAGIREQLSLVNIPKGMQGMAIALVTAGLLAMAFMGFSGVDKGLGVLFGIE